MSTMSEAGASGTANDCTIVITAGPEPEPEPDEPDEPDAATDNPEE